MFGKNDSLVDNSYKHAPVQSQPNLAPQEMAFGTAGGSLPSATEDFMSATPPSPAAAPVSTPQAEPQFAPQSFVPQDAAPVMQEYTSNTQPLAEPATSIPSSAFPEEDAPRVAPTPSPRTTTMSFSEMMAMRQAQHAAPSTNTMEETTPAPADFAQEFTPDMPASSPQQAAPDATAITPTHEQAPSVTDDPALQEAEPQEMSYAPQAVEGFTVEQTEALQNVVTALSHPHFNTTSGKTQLYAATLKVLVNKTLAQDASALSQLNSYGFDLAEKLVSDLPPRSEILDATIGSVVGLVSTGLISFVDNKTQQVNALQAIADGISQQGQTPLPPQQHMTEEQGFAQREAEKKATRQEGVATGQYL